MNKKGFTLVELLAVIVLLSVVMLMATVSVNGVQRKMHERTFNTKLMNIIQGAKDWGEDNRSSLPEYVTVRELLGSEYLTSTLQADNGEYYLENDVTGENINDLEITVYLEHNRVYACIEKNNNNDNLLEIDYSDYECQGDI